MSWTRICFGCKKRLLRVTEKRTLSVTRSHDILDLPSEFLRASDPSNFDTVTLQRNNVSFELDNGKPLLRDLDRPGFSIQTASLEGGIYRITWGDGVVSEYPDKWVQEQLKDWKNGLTDRVLWHDLSEEELRASTTLSLPFDDVLTPDGQSRGLRALYQYGILLVSQTPIRDNGAGVAALASALGGGTVKNSSTSVLNQYLAGGSELSLPRGTDGPLRTLYGTVWSTTSAGQAKGASVADSAYGCEGLPLHTDMTYLNSPPGLQIFTMVEPAARGGASIFGDGFAAAQRLRSMNAEAFSVLSSTIRNYRCVDRQTGWHLEANGPVIALRNGKVSAIRHNDLDRLPDLPPPDEADVEAFYESLKAAHFAWNSVLAQDDLRLVVCLQPGDTIVVANQVREKKSTCCRKVASV